MQLMTVVEDYVTAAMQRATVERFDDGTLVATVSGLPGIVAGGIDVHACAEELYRRLEAWVLLSLASGQQIPVIGGVDLNPDANRTLATYHQSRLKLAKAPMRDVLQTEEELEAAFEAMDHSS